MVKSKIREIRQKNNITQKNLAEKLGVSRQALCMWESDKRELKAPVLKKIAKIFGVQIDELMNITDESIIKKEMNMATKKLLKATFELLAPDAKKVALTGDFNSWDDNGIVMKRNKSGLWKTNVELNSGVYEYKFIVDNQWWTDPKNDMKVNNPCGDLNSVVEVSA
ncbi:MAG: helix-turn-helix domain-containing protein [Candidatus Omnitrophica bacterium]|nr:helix-turn-helix domain-containing protein [Candidatus Omnitrophota bacterium]